MEWPDLHALELLVAVGELDSLSAAARRTGTAQPNASRTVARLERRWGVRLLERSSRGSTLTPQGRQLANSAERVLARCRQLQQEVERLRGAAAGHVTAAASITVAEYLAPAWLAQFRLTHPEVELRLQVCNSTEVLRRTTAGEVDVGFVETPQLPPGLGGATVAVDRLLLVVTPDHPWAARPGGIDATELAAEPLVVRESGSGTRSTLDQALAGHKLVPPAMELSSNAAVLGAARAGAGPAVLSELVVRAEVESGRLRTVPVCDNQLERRLQAVWRPPLPSGPTADLVAIAVSASP
ncbi:UNVERIFIED_CONTAM: LysR family transcriptional regulator [Kocuria sp. CPCC 205316]|uniref:LysR family transcriptional regulator n=1 Tax=Kocuria TaxID=57493 RepID=UPI0036DD53A0